MYKNMLVKHHKAGCILMQQHNCVMEKKTQEVIYQQQLMLILPFMEYVARDT